MSTDEQGQAEQAVVRFGPEPHQVISLAWAEGMLSELFSKEPDRFGRLMSAYVTGVDTRGRGRPAAPAPAPTTAPKGKETP